MQTPQQRTKLKEKPCRHSSDESSEKRFEARQTKPFKPTNRSTPSRNRNGTPVPRNLDANGNSPENLDSIKPKDELLKNFTATTLNMYALFLMEWFTDDSTKKERIKNLRHKNVKYTKQPRPDENFDISALADIIRNCNIFLADAKLQCCWNTL